MVNVLGYIRFSDIEILYLGNS